MPRVSVGVQRDYSRYSENDPGFYDVGRFLPATEKPGTVSIRGTHPVGLPNGVTFIPSFTLPLAPTDVNFSDLGDNYSELKRPGRAPLIYRSDRNLFKISTTVLVVAPVKATRGWNSAEQQIQLLRICAGGNVDLALVGMGVLTRGTLFRITSMSVKSKRLNPQQEITMAEVSLDFTEVGEKRVPIPGMIAIKDIPDPENPNQTGTAAGGNSFDPWAAAAHNWGIGNAKTG